MANRKPDAYQAAVVFAAREINTHPAVTLLGEPQFTGKGASLLVEIDLGFGHHWRAAGASPTGVLPREVVRFDFPPTFPAKEPAFSLRADFSRNHPHVQPWLTSDQRVVPCVVDGLVGEFLAARGFRDLVEQLVLWLNRAAEGILMDGGAVWEPARRDGCEDLLVVNADRLRSLVDRKGGFQFFRSYYRCLSGPGDFTPLFWGHIGEETSMKGPPLSQRPVSPQSTIVVGHSLVLALWPGKHPSGELVGCDEYLPDEFRTAAGLFERAKAFGVDTQLAAALGMLRARATGKQSINFPLCILMMVRRPRRVLGSTTNIEICGYITPLRFPLGAMTQLTDEVRPMALRDAIEPSLLRRLSGDAPMSIWALLGCGSLGSKVALHTARSGNAPGIVADKANFSPHNAARHGLYPEPGDAASGWLSQKAVALASTLGGLGTEVRAFEGDHLAFAQELIGIKGKGRKPKRLVNTTASLVVRESLAGADMAGLPPVLEMTLYDGGRLGYLAVEGSGHNPNGAELAATFYQLAANEPVLGSHLFKPTDPVNRVSVGQGCGSLTMTVSDASLSVMAGAMSEVFTSLGDTPAAQIHLLRRERVGMTHSVQVVPKFDRVVIEGLDGWSLSLGADVHRRIVEEVGKYPTVETGGILVGWSSSIARQIIVTDLIAAPTDSKRSASEFILGVEGVDEKITDLTERGAGLLRCLGTWHSHLGSARPSGVDKFTAGLIASGETRPMALLVMGVDGMRSISAVPESR